MPLRALLAGLVLAGVGLWQGWQCTDGMAVATPVLGVMTAPMTIPPRRRPTRHRRWPKPGAATGRL